MMGISEVECIARAACPRCGQPIGAPCVYVAPANAHQPCVRVEAERAGKPTRKVHNERRYVVFELHRAEPHAISPGRAGRYEVRVLAHLFNGEWFSGDDMWGAAWSDLQPALSRCYAAGWIEYRDGGWDWRITDAGVAALRERS